MWSAMRLNDNDKVDNFVFFFAIRNELNEKTFCTIQVKMNEFKFKCNWKMLLKWLIKMKM